MRANDEIRLFRFFTIADYEQEEIFLQEQHRKGFALVRCTFPGFYYFKRCEPKDVVYRLDYSDLKQPEKTDYIRMFQDYDWEYLGDMAGWSYFRKDASEGSDTEIFSDDVSRLDLVEKVIKTRMLPVLLIFFCCTLPGFLSSVRYGMSGYFVFWVILFLLYGYIVLHCGRGLLKLRKKYGSSGR